MVLKQIALASSTVIALVATAQVGPARAADMPVKAPPRLMATPYNWSGLYIGGHVGGGGSDKCFNQVAPAAVFSDTGCHDGSGWLAGGQIGYNWQQANWLFGVEFSGSGADISGSHVPPTGSINDNLIVSSEVSSLFLFTGRIGMTWSQAVAYVKGGAAWAHDKYQFAETNQPTIETRQSRWGWTIGAGLEIGFTPNWSIAFEYNYVDFGNRNTNLDPTWTIAVDQSMHIGTARLNYHFNSPIGGRY
jgi:outer membrane immunogenic protein